MKDLLRKKTAKPGSPASVIMRGCHSHGGEATPLASQTTVNANPSNHYKKGGHCKHRAMGGDMGDMPIGAKTISSLLGKSMRRPIGLAQERPKFTIDMGMPGGKEGMKAPPVSPEAQQGAAPAMRRGGRMRSHGREHHFLGLLAGLLPTIASGICSLFSGGDKKEAAPAPRQSRPAPSRRMPPPPPPQYDQGDDEGDEGYKRGGRTRRSRHFEGGHAGGVSEAILRELGGTDIHNERDQNSYGKFHHAPSTTRIARKRGGRAVQGSGEHHANPASKLMRGSKQHADGEKDPSQFRHKPSTTRIKRAMGGAAKERKDFPFA